MRKTRARLGAAAVALALVAVACGSDDDDDDSSSSSAPTSTQGSASTAPGTTASGASTSTTEAPGGPPADMDPNGILKFGEGLAPGTGVHFDPTRHRAASVINSYYYLVYGSLTRWTADNTLEPWMAEDIEIVDPQTVEITLRPDTVFTDGSKYDAEAVSTSMLRHVNGSMDETVKRGLHPGMKIIQAVDVVDPLTVKVTLSSPQASLFLEALATMGGLVQSPKQIAEDPASIDTKPIGAGPYVLEEFVDQSLIRLVKNPDFFDADAFLAPEIHFVHTPRGPQVVNGLLAGTINLAEDVPIDTAGVVESNDDFTVEAVPGRWSGMWSCATKPPFDNPEFRKAVLKGIDREEYNELVYQGKGTPAYGYFKEGDASYDPKVKEIAGYDPDGAKKILADAGLTNVTFDLWHVASNNFSRNAEVVQAQLKEIGINVVTHVGNNIYDEWIAPKSPGALMAFQPGQPKGGYTHFVKTFGLGQSASFCDYENKEVLALASQAVALPPEDPKAIDLYRQANLLALEGFSNWYPLIFEPMVKAYHTDIGGTFEYNAGYGQADLTVESIGTLYVKK